MAGAGSYLYLLGEAIGAFRAQRSCPLRLLTGDREATMAALRTGRAQLGVTVLRTVPEDVKADMVCRVPAMVVVARGHRLTRRRSVSLRDLDGESLIVPPPKAPFRETLETYLSQHKVSWKVGVEAGGWELMMRFVEWGLGITVVNGCCQAPAGCRAIPLKDLPTVDYYVLSARASRLDENAEALRAAILRRGFLSPC